MKERAARRSRCRRSTQVAAAHLLYYPILFINIYPPPSRAPIEQNAIQELERLEHAFDSVKRVLFKRLHDRLRQELFHSSSSEDEDATPSSNLAARVTQAVELVRGAATSTKPL